MTIQQQVKADILSEVEAICSQVETLSPEATLIKVQIELKAEKKKVTKLSLSKLVGDLEKAVGAQKKIESSIEILEKIKSIPEKSSQLSSLDLILKGELQEEIKKADKALKKAQGLADLILAEGILDTSKLAKLKGLLLKADKIIEEIIEAVWGDAVLDQAEEIKVADQIDQDLEGGALKVQEVATAIDSLKKKKQLSILSAILKLLTLSTLTSSWQDEQ